MVEHSFSIKLKGLVDNYYNGQLNFNEYRIQRKILLDQIEKSLNEVEPDITSTSCCKEEPTLDAMRTVNYFDDTKLDNSNNQ